VQHLNGNSQQKCAIGVEDIVSERGSCHERQPRPQHFAVARAYIFLDVSQQLAVAASHAAQVFVVYLFKIVV
jgi:hypothetical protein